MEDNTTATYHNGGASTNAAKNHITYRSYFYDTDLSLYYLQSRYYDSFSGRFINADKHINANGDILGYNMFAYCGNNPVNATDPTGEFVFTITVMTLYSLALATTAAYAAVTATISSITHTIHSIEREKAIEGLKDSYSTAGATTKIEEILGKYRLMTNAPYIKGGFGEVAFQIGNSYQLSYEDRTKITEILARTEGFDRSGTSLSAEWKVHDVWAFVTNYTSKSAIDVDLDYKVETMRDDVRLFTNIFQFLGIY